MAEMVGDGDEVIFGIFGQKKFSARFLGNFPSSLYTVTVCPCVPPYTPLVSGSPNRLRLAPARNAKWICTLYLEKETSAILSNKGL